MDTTLVAILVAIAAVLIAILVRQLQLRGATPSAGQEGGQEQQAGGAKATAGKPRQRRVNRMRTRRGAAARDADVGAADADDVGDLTEDEEDEDGPVASKKLGAKKLKKLQEKEERRKMREYEEAQRREAKEREELLRDQERKAEEEKEAEEQRKQEEEERKKEEQRQREIDEYNNLRAMFAVEEGGSQANDIEQESQGLLAEFVDFIKEKKVVMLEDLAARFSLKSQEALNRLRALEEMSRITGVTDDRGKFIYISPDELDKVAQFIRRRGRVSIEELVENSNKLITLERSSTAT